MTTRLEQAADGKSWNLYVNGHIAVSYESFSVCDQVRSELLDSPRGNSYSEGAEVADVIRRKYQHFNSPTVRP